MPQRSPTPLDPATRKSLRWPLLATRLGLIAENLTRAAWPVWSILLLAVAALGFELHQHFALEVVWVGGVSLVLAGLAAFAFAVRKFHWPSLPEAEARLDATLGGRPLASLQDAQAIGAGDAASRAVWDAHQARMRDKLAGAKPVAPRLSLAERDIYGLRYLALLLCAMALLFGTALRIDRLTGADPSARAALAASSWEGWVEPPNYTNRPSLYLNDIPSGPLQLPEGSRVSFRLYGDAGALAVSQTVTAPEAAEAGGEGTGQNSDPIQSFTIARAGRIAVTGPQGASWDISLMPDESPETHAKLVTGYKEAFFLQR
ncbi:MAG: DUF4175 family protein, partial [Mangrovicoccus sp.]